MALPIRSAWFVLVCFSVVSHGRPPIADPTGLLDQAVRGAARLGIALTAPVVNIARGITERIEPVIVRDPDVVAASRGVVSTEKLFIMYCMYIPTSRASIDTLINDRSAALLPAIQRLSSGGP